LNYRSTIFSRIKSEALITIVSCSIQGIKSQTAKRFDNIYIKRKLEYN
jgi:hypothetical protein